MKKLIVTTRFGGYSVGDPITDPQEINDLLSNEHSAHVVAVTPGYEDEPELVDLDAPEEAIQDATDELASPINTQPEE